MGKGVKKLNIIEQMDEADVEKLREARRKYMKLYRDQKRVRKYASRLRKNQSGILYILVTIVLFLFVIGFVWFAAWAIMSPISQTIEPIAESYYDSSWPLWTQFQYALTFMSNFWTYLLALAFFGLVFWVYMYSQHRGQAY